MLYNTGNLPQRLFTGFPGLGARGGGDTGISAANNAMASVFGSLLGNQASNRATDANLAGRGLEAQAGLLSSIFGNQSQLAGSQFGNLASLLGDMYGAKSGATASLGNAAAGRDASMFNSQAGLYGQGLNSQANVINSLAGLQGGLNSNYANLDSQRMDQEFQLGKLGALSPLLGSLFGRVSGGGSAGLPSFASNYGASASWR